jgi:transposase
MLNKYLVQRLDHLGLVAGMCKKLELEEYLNKKLPATGKDKKLSYGTLVIGMILNGLGFLKVSNGNSSDKANFAEIVKELYPTAYIACFYSVCLLTDQNTLKICFSSNSLPKGN